MAITMLSDSGLAGNKYYDVAAGNTYMEPIATQLLGASTATVTFDNIPQNYTHLQVRYIANWTSTTTDYSTFTCTLNGDNGTNYSQHQLYGAGSASGGVGGLANTSNMLMPWIPYTTYTNVFGAGVLDILDYTNQNKYKVLRVLGGFERNNAPGVIGLISGSWMNTSPITKISFSTSSNAFGQYTRFSLYGLKG